MGAKKRPAQQSVLLELQSTQPAAKSPFQHESHWLQGAHLGMKIFTLRRTVALSQGPGSCFPVKIHAAKIDSFLTACLTGTIVAWNGIKRQCKASPLSCL